MTTKLGPAIAAFADGAILHGVSIGYAGIAIGEAVFNTAISGYQEIISDPSYHQQIINFTHPHIGNTGVNAEDNESDAVFAAGVIARKITATPSNWRATQPLSEYLQERKIPAIAGIDTRAVTRKLREQGAIAVCIAPTDDETTINNALAAARNFSGLSGAMLAQETGQTRPQTWQEGLWQASGDKTLPTLPNNKYRIIVLDCGVKNAILQNLIHHSCEVIVMPYGADINRIIENAPDGVLLSNGPGDPQPCESAITLARELMAHKIPILGICLGHQILAAALGAVISKMKFGHHGANHPVRNENNGRILITSQNHGFTVEGDSLPANVRRTHVSLFDNTLQGFACDDPPLITFQGHPEASPGPRDAASLFSDFIALIKSQKQHTP